MLFWTLAALVLYVSALYLPVAFLLPRMGLLVGLRGRDVSIDLGLVGERAKRAASNMLENMVLFLPLALLSFVVEGTDQEMAVRGAAIFVIARLVYIPAYMSAILGLRSLCYGVSMAGLLMMALALV